MSLRDVLMGINLLIVAGLGIYVLMQPRGERRAYVVNQRVFEGFEGKKELEEKLNVLRSGHKRHLDSLSRLVTRENERTLVPVYNQSAQAFALKEQEVSGQYTADIWKSINQHIAAYGKEEGYDFILGASGDGSLMYADESYDITDDVIQYVNAKYNAH